MSQSMCGCTLIFSRAGASLTQLCCPAPIRVPRAQNWVFMFAPWVSLPDSGPCKVTAASEHAFCLCS